MYTGASSAVTVRAATKHRGCLSDPTWNEFIYVSFHRNDKAMGPPDVCSSTSYAVEMSTSPSCLKSAGLICISHLRTQALQVDTPVSESKSSAAKAGVQLADLTFWGFALLHTYECVRWVAKLHFWRYHC